MKDEKKVLEYKKQMIHKKIKEYKEHCDGYDEAIKVLKSLDGGEKTEYLVDLKEETLKEIED